MTGQFVRRAAIVGAVSGAATWHMALVGLIDAFQIRPIITGYLSLGELLPIAVAIIAGYWAARPSRPGAAFIPTPAQVLLSGAVAGLASGIMLAILSFFILGTKPNGMLIHATPKLVNELRYYLDAGLGTLAQLGGGLILGVAGSALHVTPRILRRPFLVAVGVVLLFGIMNTFVVQILRNIPGIKSLSSVLYKGDGLTIVGVVILFVLAAGVTAAWLLRGQQVRTTYRAMPRAGQQTTKIIAFVLLAALVLILPQILGVFLSDVITNVGLFVLLGLGLNIVVGFAGLLDLGYVAFYALGIYSIAVLTSPASPAFHPELNFWLAVPIVMVIGGVTGIVIGAPVLRLRGDYLAIVTLGFGEIARIIFLSDWMTPYVGGAQGIQQIPAPRIDLLFWSMSFRKPQDIYYPILVACILAAIVAWSFQHSRVGRAWTAMREDETVAEATGVNTTVYKLMAFSMGAVFGSVAGAFYAAKIGVVFPQNLDILISINALALIILGGMGSITGVIVGAFMLVGLPGLLREFAEYQLLIFGAVLVAMMLFRPEGLIPNRSRRAELHDEEEVGAPDEGGGQGGPGADTPGADRPPSMEQTPSGITMDTRAAAPRLGESS